MCNNRSSCSLPPYVSSNDLNVYFSAVSVIDNAVKTSTILYLHSVVNTGIDQFNFLFSDLWYVKKVVDPWVQVLLALTQSKKIWSFLFLTIFCLNKTFLTQIINHSLASGVFSSLWWKAFIIYFLKNCNPSFFMHLQIYAHAGIKDVLDAVAKSNTDLQRTYIWSNRFGIAVNHSKCQPIIIGSKHRLDSISVKCSPYILTRYQLSIVHT